MKRLFKHLAVVALPVLSAMTLTAQAAPTGRAFPPLHLDQPARGEAAIRALAGTLPAVAEWYGKTPAEFARLIRQDPDLWLDARGRVFFVDEGMAMPEQATTADPAAGGAVSAVTPDQAFLLHSRPGANRTLYLNFQGGVVTGTAWNASYGLTTISAQPYDTDGNPAAFSTTELQNIISIWQRVAEDYAPFDVDVTTELPLPGALTRSSSSDATFGTTVLVTRDWTTGAGKPCSCGGFAYLGVFDDTTEYYKPAWVFFDRLGNGNEKYVAEAISHEAGHNLGLNHDGYNDGTSSTGYYAGAGNWAPIMGVGYYKALTQWSKGEYPYATNKEDDLAVIQTYGLPLVADEHGDDLAMASILPSSTANGVQSFAGSGIVRARGDIDAFRFTIGAGSLTLDVAPAEKGPNLDLAVALYDANGVQIATANPADRLNAGISLASVAAGSYFLVVDGVGNGDLATGYSDYASLGAFRITGSAAGATTVGSPPVAQLAASPVTGTAPLPVNFSSAGSYDPDGGALFYSWQFGDGASSTAASPAHTYTAAGNYVASLVVTDASGASSAPVQTAITVAPAPLVAVHVQNIAMSLAIKGRNAQGVAVVTVTNGDNQPVSGAVVTGRWSGLLNKSVSGTTGSDGSVRFATSSTSKSGTFTFTVTGVAGAGFAYDATANVESSDSVSR